MNDIQNAVRSNKLALIGDQQGRPSLGLAATTRSVAGDDIKRRAEMDLVIGLTAWSTEKLNIHRLKPIDYEVVSHHGDGL